MASADDERDIRLRARIEAKRAAQAEHAVTQAAELATAAQQWEDVDTLLRPSIAWAASELRRERIAFDSFWLQGLGSRTVFGWWNVRCVVAGVPLLAEIWLDEDGREWSDSAPHGSGSRAHHRREAERKRGYPTWGRTWGNDDDLKLRYSQTPFVLRPDETNQHLVLVCGDQNYDFEDHFGDAIATKIAAPPPPQGAARPRKRLLGG